MAAFVVIALEPAPGADDAMTKIALLVVVAMLTSACGASSVYAPTSTPVPTQIVATATLVPIAPIRTPPPTDPVADPLRYEPLVRDFVNALERNDVNALSHLFGGGRYDGQDYAEGVLRIGHWCQPTHTFSMAPSSVKRFLASPRLRPTAIVKTDSVVPETCISGTGVLLENWNDRELELDSTPDSGVPRSVELRPVLLGQTANAVVLVSHSQYRGTPGVFFGLSSTEKWIKVADLP